MDFTVALIGAGNMGGAMLRGWLANGMAAGNISIVDPGMSDEMRSLVEETGIEAVASADGIQAPDVLLVAVKPQMMDDVLPKVRSLVSANTVTVSVAAGTTLATLENGLGAGSIVRVMPNTPALVGCGMSVACANGATTNAQKQQVTQLMQAIGALEWVSDEALIDGVTAVSGSGPAYVFYLAECMASAGEKAGLPRDLAMTLARETVSGAGELLRQSSEEPAQLRKNVTSPGGTTAAALEVLMREGGMAQLFDEAIAAAKKRSEEL